MFKKLIIPFIVGGLIVSGIKYTVSDLNNTKLAVIIAGAPLGLFSIYFLEKEKVGRYGRDYIYMGVILVMAIIAFNIAFSYFKISKDKSQVIAVAIWVLLAIIRYNI